MLGSAPPWPVEKLAGCLFPAPNSCCDGDGGCGVAAAGCGGGSKGGGRRLCCCWFCGCGDRGGGTGLCCSSGGAGVVSLLAAAGRGSGRPGAKGFMSGARKSALSTPNALLSTTIGVRPPGGSTSASRKPGGSGGPRVDCSSISIGMAAPKASSRLAEIAASIAPWSTCAISMSSSWAYARAPKAEIAAPSSTCAMSMSSFVGGALTRQAEPPLACGPARTRSSTCAMAMSSASSSSCALESGVAAGVAHSNVLH